MPPTIPPEITAALRDLATGWAESKASEKASFQTWLIRFCEALGVAEVIAAFDGAKRELVTRHLETLTLMGEVVVDGEGRYGVSRKAA